MKRRFSILLVFSVGIYVFSYLFVNSFLAENRYFLAEVVNLTATVPPAIVAIDDAPIDSGGGSSGGGGYTKKTTVIKPTTEPTDEPLIETDEEPPMEPIDKTITPPLESKTKIITIEPAIEPKDTVIEAKKELVINDETLTPYASPDTIVPYLDQIFPQITRKNVNDKDNINKLFENITALNVDKVSTESKIELYANRPIIFTGKTVPNAKLEIEFFSKVQRDVIFADKNGDWFWSAPKPVDVGEHSLNILIRDQNNAIIKTKNISLFVKAPDSSEDQQSYISLTPGYLVVSPIKPFAFEINFYNYSDSIEYPIRIDYEIINEFGDLYGEGSAAANPDGGTVVRLPIQLNPGTKAGFYRIHVTSIFLDKEVYADAIFNVLEDYQLNNIDADKVTTAKQNNLFVLKAFLLLMGVSGLIYISLFLCHKG